MLARHVQSTAGGVGAIAAETGEDMAVLVLDSRGMIRDCNRTGETLFGYRRGELAWRHVSMLLPQLAELDLVPNGQPNPHLRFLNRIGRHFEAATRDGERFACALFLNLLDSTGQGRLSLLVRPVEDETGQPTATDACRHGREPVSHAARECAR
jgi:PAS domain S-box-containing protein